MKLKYIAILVAVALTSLTSCKDFLDKVPDTRVYLNNVEQLRQLMVDGYMASSYACVAELSSDNVIDNNSPSDDGVIYNLSAYDISDNQLYAWQDVDLASGNDTPSGVWSGCYGAIAVCNLADGVRRVRVSMEACGFKDSMMLRNATLQVDLSTVRTDSFTVVLPGHATTVFIARGPRCEKTLYEAEESWMKCYNEIGKSGPDFRQKDNTSGGCIVGNLGKNADNYMEWRNVWSDRGGEYTLTLHYLSAESRTLYLMVNGESPTRIGGLNSGSWEVTGTRTCKISLNPGFNTIRLYNNSAHMPDVDCITLKSESTEGIGKTVSQSGKPVRVEYFNMLGQPTPKEAPGMKIRRATYGDGSTKSKKIG